MPTRSQFLVLTGLLAIGMTLGSLGTYFFFPAALGIAKVGPKDAGPEPHAAVPKDPLEAKVAPEVKAPEASKALAVAPKPVVAKIPAPEKKPNPDDVLSKKGLKRSNLVYVLDAEDDLRQGFESLHAIYDRWETSVVKMNQQANLLLQCQNALDTLMLPAGQLNAGAADGRMNPEVLRAAIEKEMEALNLAPAEKQVEPEGKKQKRDQKNKPFNERRLFFAQAPDAPQRPLREQMKGQGQGLRGGETDLLLLSVNDVNEIPAEGMNLLIVATVDRVLHFRAFDENGQLVVNIDESRMTNQGRPIEDFKKQLANLQPHKLTKSEKQRVIAAASLIVGQALGGMNGPGHQEAIGAQPGFRGPGHILDKEAGQSHTGMPGKLPGKEGSTGANETGHPEPESKEKREKRLYVVLPVVFQVNLVQRWRRELEINFFALLDAYYTQEMQALNCVQEFQWRRAAVQRQAMELEQQYETLSKDAEVVAAIEEINKTADPKLAIGPREKYRENLAKMTERLLEKEGVVKDLGGNFQFTRIAVVAESAKLAEEELRDAVDAQQKLELKVVEDRRQLANAIEEKKPDLAAILVKDEDELRALGPKVAEKREVYVQRVAALSKLVADAPKNAAKVKKEIGVAIGRTNPQIVSYLASRQKTITKPKDVELRRDKTIFWVKVTLSGKTSEMVLEPTVEEIRMSADSAAELGIKVDRAGPPVEVTLIDGRKLAASRVTLKAVQVETLTAENVECLVIPEGFDSPPLLGASFLNRFSYRFDPDEAKISLVKVDPKLFPKRK